MASSLSVVIITKNEEANLARTLASLAWLLQQSSGEIIVLDSGSADRTREIAQSAGAKVFVEQWQGYAAQKNSAISKAGGDWVLSLDADEELSPQLSQEIASILREGSGRKAEGYWLPRKNFFLGRWVRHGGFYPDRKLRLFRRGQARVEARAVHETIQVSGPTGVLQGALLHHAYPTLTSYIEHMNQYSSLGAGMANVQRGFSFLNIVIRPAATFVYNYFLRLGFLDGREGLLLHLYHAAYVSWKYAKAWELARNPAARKI